MEQQETYYQQNKEKIKIYEERNKEKRLEYRKKHYLKNKKYYQEYQRNRYLQREKKRRSDDTNWVKDFECFKNVPRHLLLRILNEVQ